MPVRVAALDEVPDNGKRAFTVEGREVLIARTALGIFAVSNICTHQYQKLEEGKVKACYIFCPAHGVRFDLRDGKPSGTLTGKALDHWPVIVSDGAIHVDFGDG
jgi:3-phenylpropionate/trans-cinnamate dioxygenase ferredoxin subunit